MVCALELPQEKAIQRTKIKGFSTIVEDGGGVACCVKPGKDSVMAQFEIKRLK